MLFSSPLFSVELMTGFPGDFDLGSVFGNFVGIKRNCGNEKNYKRGKS